MKYNALIFDMDGTLVHNMPVHNKALEDTLAEAGVQLPVDMTEFINSTYGKKATEVFRGILGIHATDSDVIYWTERKEALYRERFAPWREPLPGLLQLLEQARNLGLPMAVASASPPENVSFILDELNLQSYFKVVLTGQDVQHGKPDPEIFLKSANELGVAPSECLVFEDGRHGIEAARRANMDAVLITTTLDAREVAAQSHVICAVPDFTHLDLPALRDGAANR
jgi:beta-phosphoglucomutase family hydrolase